MDRNMERESITSLKDQDMKVNTIKDSVKDMEPFIMEQDRLPILVT